MSAEELSMVNEGLFAARQRGTRIEKMSQEEITYIARGLGRSLFIGRQPNGLPITERSIAVEELLKRNRSRIEEVEEQ